MNLSDNVSIIIVTYNHIKFINECLNSLTKKKSFEIIVVDNKSTDGTPEFIGKKFPNVTLIRNSENYGYGIGNNIGVNSANMDFIVILNPDTKVTEDAIDALVKPLENQENIITTPKILLYDGSKINTCGNIEHFTGLTFTRGLGVGSELFDNEEFINGLSGACFAIKKKDYIKLKGFDKNFLVYMEDAELSWKSNLYGFNILYVPKSVIFHEYQLKVSPEKIFHLERGRYVILRKYFDWKTLLIISPSLLMTELLTWGYSVLNGLSGLKYKYKAIREGLTFKVEKNHINNNELLNKLEWEIPMNQLNYNFIDVFIKKIANFVYNLNYHIIMKWR